MKKMSFMLWAACGLSLFAYAAVAKDPPPDGTASAITPDQRAEALRLKAVEQAQALIHDGEPERAIAILDAVIAEYETQYPDGETRWYVARDTKETLAYMVSAATSKDGTHKNASALIVMWAEAYYLKGYALVELGTGGSKIAKSMPIGDPAHLAPAKKALERGIHLAPYHARMLSELGQIHQLEKDWDNAYRYYAAAEDASAFTPEDEQASDLGRAKRGMGFVLIEQGKLDEAEKKFEECLEIDPDDSGAKREMLYIRSLREQSGR